MCFLGSSGVHGLCLEGIPKPNVCFYLSVTVQLISLCTRLDCKMYCILVTPVFSANVNWLPEQLKIKIYKKLGYWGMFFMYNREIKVHLRRHLRTWILINCPVIPSTLVCGTLCVCTFIFLASFHICQLANEKSFSN